MESKIDLTELFSSDEKFLEGIEEANKLIKEIPKYEGHLYDSAEKLYEFLTYDVKLSKLIERLYLYAHINSDLDMTNTKYQEYVGKVINLFNEISEFTSFATSELLEKDYDYFLSLVNDYPELAEFKINMKKLFRAKKYIKSKDEEKLISILTSSYGKPEDISELLINTDLSYGTIKDENGNDVELTNSNFSTYLESSNRDVRKAAFDKMYDEIKAHENTFGGIFGTEILNNNKLAKIRGFNSAREYSLYSNDIDNKIYDELIRGVHNNLDRFYEYYKFKKKVLGLDEMHLYDTYASIVKDFDKKYTYEEAKQIVLESLKPLGEEYQKLLERAFDENWIDSRIIKTKRSGAYCTHCYDTHPYVVLSYEGKVNDISTIVHELGHAMHSYYSISNNKYQDSDYSIFVAEVASQVNEILLTDYLLKNTDDKEEKKYLLDLMLQRFKATVLRQTMFAEFEDILHKLENNGEILTKDLITNEYYKLNELYFGKDVVVDDKIKYECFRIPHFYMNFYVYQYSTGYIAAMKIALDILNGKKGAVENYIEFLKLGSTKDPVTELKQANVDIENTKVYDEVFDVFEKRLNELRCLYE